MSAPIILILQLRDPYTRNIMLRNLFPLTKEEAKLKKKEMKRKGVQQSSSSSASLFASSLSLEIIYTVLNSVVTIIQQSHDAVDIKDNRKKKEQSYQRMERSLTRHSVSYDGMDYYDEKIYRITDMKMKNLD